MNLVRILQREFMTISWSRAVARLVIVLYCTNSKLMGVGHLFV